MVLQPFFFRMFLPHALIAVVTAANCYNYNGGIVSNQWPCHPERAVSNCCSYNDFCLDNGLCLDAGGNNYYSQQGCTDRDFGDPCNYRCAIDGSDGSSHGDYHVLWLCDGSEGAYCCGEDGSCCFNSTVTQITLGKYTTVSRAPSATSVPGGTVATVTNMATTTVGTATETASTSAGLCTAAEFRAKQKDGVIVGLGAGFGIAVLLSMVGFYAGAKFTKKKMNKAKKSDNDPANNSDPNIPVPKQATPQQHNNHQQQYPPAQELPGQWSM